MLSLGQVGLYLRGTFTQNTLAHVCLSIQICMSTERVIVQRGVSDALISELTALASKMKAGPNGSGSHISGVFSEASAANIVSLLKDAHDEGAKVIVGDLKYNGPYIQPHVVLGYKPRMRAWENETFGPGMSSQISAHIRQVIQLGFFFFIN
jgi:acyl-CoA reductase-like NAD-dependent aldehyde dehydrogenase